MNLGIRNALACVSLLGRRSREVGQPGLTIYAEAGAQTVRQVVGHVRDLAHKNECAEITAADRLKQILADGRVDAAELTELQALPATLTRCAGRSHDITEAMDS